MARDHASTSASGGPTKKARTQQSAADAVANRILERNQYSVLPEDSGDGETIAKKERVPPLFTPVKDVTTLEAELSKQACWPCFKLCSVGTKIVCSSLAQYKKVGDLLVALKVPFYTHDVPSAKPLKVVLRGLPPLEAPAVKGELEKKGLQVQAVYPMARRAAVDTNFRDQLYLVHITKGSTSMGELKKIRDLFRIIVTWEPYRPQHRDVTQCTKCLWFGHGTKNCNMTPRCDKCAGAHETATCVQPDDMDPKCTNCEANHRATNRACPKRAEFVRIRQKATSSNQPGRQRADRAPPASNERNFPALQSRRQAPNLAPLPLNRRVSAGTPVGSPTNQAASNRNTVQHRLTAAAAQSSQDSSSTPGLSYARVVSGDNSDDTPFTSEELVTLVAEVIVILRTCRTRAEQLHAALSLVSKYGP